MAHTSHGQPIWGTPAVDVLTEIRKSYGGSRVCPTCKRESALYHPSNTKKKVK